MASKGYDMLREQLKDGTLQNIYIFYGEETYLRENALQQLRQALLPEGMETFNYHFMDGKSLEIQTLGDTVEAMPMMAQHTLVVVEDLNIFALDQEQQELFIALLGDIPDYCTLVFVYNTIEYKRDKKKEELCDALKKHVCEVEFAQQERRQLVGWVRRRFAALGHEIDDTTADHLLFTCGSLMTGLISEIDKIGAYAKEQRITVADINAVAEPVLDAKVFDMTNRITAGKYDEAAQVLADLLRMQAEPIMLLAVMGKELRRLYTARLALESGKDRFWLKQLWGMASDYPAKLLLQAAKKVDRRWCRSALLRCQTLDRRMKSERGIDREAELKLFLMELAGTR